MNILNLSPIGISYNTNSINSYEYVLVPIYVFIFYFLTKILIDVNPKNKIEKKYIYPALGMKIVGGLFITLIYNFYYQGGDTSIYFNESKVLSNIIFENPESIFRVLFYNPLGDDTELKNFFAHLNYMNGKDTLIVLKITALLNIFSFNSYLITTFFYSYISFWCIWRLMRLLFRLYPNNKTAIVIAFFYTPSLVVWGSGILKDTICFSCLCLLHYYLYRIFIEKKVNVPYVIYVCITGYLLFTIKIYILLAYVPCFLFLTTQFYKSYIHNRVLKSIVSPVIIILGIAASYFIISQIGGEKTRYSTSNLFETAKLQRTYLHSVSLRTNGSTYDLDIEDGNFVSYILNIPTAINVTLFRPYLWEIKNIIMLFSSLESVLVLFITLRLLYKRNWKNTFRTISLDSNLQFFIVFSLIFSFFVGITSSNFGSLVRYKIQGLPFYILFILLLYNSSSKKKSKKQINASLSPKRMD